MIVLFEVGRYLVIFPILSKFLHFLFEQKLAASPFNRVFKTAACLLITEIDFFFDNLVIFSIVLDRWFSVCLVSAVPNLGKTRIFCFARFANLWAVSVHAGIRQLITVDTRFVHRFISLNQSGQSQGSSMLVNINDSHLLGDSTIVNVRNLSRQKVFLRSFFFSISTWQCFTYKKVNYLNREGCVRHLDFFLKFNSFS